MFYCS